MAYSVEKERKYKYIIVGVDPGTTTGIAVMGLDGTQVEVFSAKNLSLSEVITWIASHGKPLIIASDVTPAPEMVKKIRSAFSSVLHVDKSLSTEEKKILTKSANYKYKYKNVHERDALAACIETFRRYKKKFLQVEKKTPPEIDVEEVKALVVQGVSINKTINKLSGIEVEERKEEEMIEEKAREGKEGIDEETLRLRKIISEKEEQIKRQKEFLEELKHNLEEKEAKIRNLEEKLKHIQEERKKEIEEEEEIIKREKEILRLKEVIREKERENVKLWKKITESKDIKEIRGKKRLKVIKNFSKNSIMDVERKYGIEEGEVVFLKDSSGGGATTADFLVKKGISAVIYRKNLSHFAYQKFLELGMPTFSIKEIPLEMKEGFVFVDEHLLSNKIEEWKSKREKEEEVVLFV